MHLIWRSSSSSSSSALLVLQELARQFPNQRCRR
jgi:hypothetical protein